jgi:ankyrin repeat protein
MNTHYEDKFFLAVQLQDHPTIERLIDKEVDVNARNGNALTTAAIQGDYLTVQMLLKAGAEVNADKTKALRMAAQNGHHAIVELLAQYGAENFDAAIKAAANKKKRAALAVLLSHADQDNESQYRAIARNRNLLNIVQTILNGSNEHDFESLMAFILDDDIDAIEELTPTDLLQRVSAKKYRV